MCGVCLGVGGLRQGDLRGREREREGAVCASGRKRICERERSGRERGCLRAMRVTDRWRAGGRQGWQAGGGPLTLPSATGASGKPCSLE